MKKNGVFKFGLLLLILISVTSCVSKKDMIYFQNDEVISNELHKNYALVISTNADPVTGEPLISTSDQKRHWEIYKGQTSDGGKTWKWYAITKNSTTDNLRPNIPSNPGGKRIILWTRGNLKTFNNYRLDVWGLAEDRE